MKLKNKNILMIVAFKNYRDEEFVFPYNEFLKEGAKISVCSTELGMAQGMFGHQIKIDLTTAQAKAQDYHAIVYIGGKGTPTIRSNEAAIRLLTEAMQDDKKVIAAICWAPTILAKAGALKNKKATVWLGEDQEYQKKTNEILTQFGAKYTQEHVVRDGNIITGDGAQAALPFALSIIEKLQTI